MDIQALVQALSNTLDPSLGKQAEAALEEVHRLPDFTPCLLQIVINETVPQPTRQAGAVYLKNSIFKYWKERDPNDSVGEELPYSIPEPAKTLIRDNVIGAIIQAPPLISRQLCVCLEQILRHDFPERWTGIVTAVHAHLASDIQATWLGSLQALYQLSKKYKFKKAEERKEYIEAMKTLLPLIYQRLVIILPDPSLPSVTLQHHILKIFYATMQYALPLDLMNESSLPGWVFVLQTIIQRPVPPEALVGDADDLPQLIWWKCKKWALHIVCRLYDRYGNPASAEKEYTRFAEYYIKTFNAGVINVLLRQLDVKRQGNYVSPRVIQGIFNYFVESVNHANSWKLIKSHFHTVFTDIVFPLMCHSDEDDALWDSDPYEYIRMKFDIFEDLVSPVVAAQTFLAAACAKRKNTLDPVMTFCSQVLNGERDARKKDGVLNVIGQVAETLMKKKAYKKNLEPMLVAHVFPEFQAQEGYMRARACWMLHYFSEIDFPQDHLQYGLQQVFNCLTQDSELPVKVEAAVALQFLIKHQEAAETFIKPHVKPIIEQLLVVIRETENDDLTAVMQELIETYADDIADVAVNLCASLVATFNELVDQGTDEDSYRALTALGILTAVQSLVKATFNESKIMALMESTCLPMLATILRNGVMDFYEEMLSLLDLFTTISVSEQMWPMLEVIYETFSRDGFDYFTEMMSVLYNFVKADTNAFLSNPKYIEIILAMCKQILSGDPGEDPQVHACKLLEVLVLQCQGRIDAYIPNIMGAVLERLTQQSKTSELKTMCLQVVISGLFYNTAMMLELLEKTHFPDSPEAITAQFFTQWVKDATADLYTGVHDRKMSVLGLCSVIQCPVRPAPVLSLANQFVPAMIAQLETLIDLYKQIAAEAVEGEALEDGEMQEEDEGKELDSEEDDEDDAGQEYLRQLAKTATKTLRKSGGGGGDDECDDADSSESSEPPQTLLEIDYDTVIDDEDVIDEFALFRNLLEALSQHDQQWYAILTGSLTQEQAQKIQQIFLYADQRKALRESRAVEVAGGYKFNITVVPNDFAFGTNPS